MGPLLWGGYCSLPRTSLHPQRTIFEVQGSAEYAAMLHPQTHTRDLSSGMCHTGHCCYLDHHSAAWIWRTPDRHECWPQIAVAVAVAVNELSLPRRGW